jgi:hypothetical protein
MGGALSGTGTNIGGSFSATGTAPQNIGASLSVSDGTINRALSISALPDAVDNHAIYSAAAAQSYLRGALGLGVAAPAAMLEIVNDMAISGMTDGQIITSTGTGAVDHVGMYIHANGNPSTNTGLGVLADSAGVNVGVYANAMSGTDNISLKISQPVAAATNWAIYADATAQSYFAGPMEFNSGLKCNGIVEHADNAAALLAGLTAGAFYRTGDLLKVVH